MSTRIKAVVFITHTDNTSYESFVTINPSQYAIWPIEVGTRHHGMPHPHDADGGTVSNMESSCEYIEYTVAV